jgi:hypothetical protein
MSFWVGGAWVKPSSKVPVSAFTTTSSSTSGTVSDAFDACSRGRGEAEAGAAGTDDRRRSCVLSLSALPPDRCV